jgi:glutamate synthase (NADPH/NADH)
VTNPAIDPFREAVVTSLRCFIGPEGDITASSPSHAHRLDLAQPVLRPQEMAALKEMNAGRWRTQVRGHWSPVTGHWPLAALHALLCSCTMLCTRPAQPKALEPDQHCLRHASRHIR